MKIVVVYALVAFLWILLSDKVVAWLFTDARTIELVSTGKGWTFVGVTALLLYGLIGRQLETVRRMLQTVVNSERDLRISHGLLLESQQIAGLGSYALNFSTGVWKSSEVCDQVFGIDAAYHRGVSGWFALVHPDERAAVLEYFRTRVVEQGQTFDKEYRIVRPSDGAVRWVHGLGQLEHDGQGCLVSMRGTILDISDRKAAEEKLVLAGRVFSNAREGISITDAQGTILDVNASFTRYTGYSREDAIGQNTRMLSSGRQDKAFYAAMWHDLLQHGTKPVPCFGACG